MSQISVQDLRSHAKTFLFSHSLESLFYGNLTLDTANKMANTIIMARRNFLENYVKEFHCANSKTAEMASGDEAASGETSEAVTTEENDATEIDIEEVE